MIRPTFLGCLLFCSCAAEPTVNLAHPAVPARTPTTCAFSGSLVPSGYLYAAPQTEAHVAEFTGSAVRVDVSLPAPGGPRRARVTVRAPPKGPALRLDGWLERDELRLFAHRDLAIVPGHVWIARGAPTYLLGDGNVLRVETRYAEGFDELAVDVDDCVSVGLEPPADRDRTLPHREVQRPHHPIASTLSLFDAPGGHLVRTLTAHEFTVVTLPVTEQRDGFLHVVLDDWVRIDGWVPARQLAPGEAADCDDCRGGVRDAVDICFGHPLTDEDDDGCVSHGELPARAAVEGVVRPGPSWQAPAVGVLERDAEVFVLARRDGWASIAVDGGGLVSPGSASFWVPAAGLHPR